MLNLLLIALAIAGVAKWINFVQDSKAQEAHDARMEELRRAREGGEPPPDVLDERHL